MVQGQSVTEEKQKGISDSSCLPWPTGPYQMGPIASPPALLCSRHAGLLLRLREHTKDTPAQQASHLFNQLPGQPLHRLRSPSLYSGPAQSSPLPSSPSPLRTFTSFDFYSLHSTLSDTVMVCLPHLNVSSTRAGTSVGHHSTPGSWKGLAHRSLQAE